jgi:hypothetical protein
LNIFNTFYNASVENFSIVEKFSTDARFNEAGISLMPRYIFIKKTKKALFAKAF